MTEPESIAAGVLVGGVAARMGADKALLPWNNTTMLESVVATARTVATDCVLLGNPKALPAPLAKWPRLADLPPNVGPIGGLAALLQNFPGRWCLLLSCDIPDVTPRVLRRLVDALRRGASIVAYRSEDGVEPCCALYHADLLPTVQHAIDGGQRSLHGIIHAAQAVIVSVDGEIRRALRNINTPDDYAGRSSTAPDG